MVQFRCELSDDPLLSYSILTVEHPQTIIQTGSHHKLECHLFTHNSQLSQSTIGSKSKVTSIIIIIISKRSQHLLFILNEHFYCHTIVIIIIMTKSRHCKAWREWIPFITRHTEAKHSTLWWIE